MTDLMEAKHLPSSLMRQTLLDKDLVRPATDHPVIRMLPWLNVVKIGGHSIMDKGAVAIHPLVADLLEAMKDHKLAIHTGAGIRGRHVYSVGLDLGLPTGALAALAAVEANKNGTMLAALMAEHGVVYLADDSMGHHLPVFLTAVPAVVGNGFPPYHLYEFPPEVGRIPPHRADTGAFLLADAYGAASMIYVEDVDGIFTADPATDPSATLIKRVGAKELIAMNLATLPIDRVVLELMGPAKHRKEIQVINGRVPGNIVKALNGEHVGTVVYAD